MTRQTPLWLQAGSYPGGYDRRLIGAIWPTAAVQGYAVSASSAMNMNIAPGTVVAPTANNTGSVLCYSDAVEVVTATAAPASGQSRIDLVVCQPRGNDLDGGANNDFVFLVVAGATATTGSQVAPAVPAGAVALAQIAIAGGTAAIVAANITDRRPVGANPYRARMINAATPQTFTAAGTVLVFDTVEYDDTAGAANKTTGTFTVPVPGDYLVAGTCATVNLPVDQTFNIAALRNSAMYAIGAQIPLRTGGIAAHVSAVVRCLNAGDRLNLQCTSSATCQAFTGTGYQWMTVHRI